MAEKPEGFFYAVLGKLEGMVTTAILLYISARFRGRSHIHKTSCLSGFSLLLFDKLDIKAE
jgi:hypothetical protein